MGKAKKFARLDFLINQQPDKAIEAFIEVADSRSGGWLESWLASKSGRSGQGLEGFRGGWMARRWVRWVAGSIEVGRVASGVAGWASRLVTAK